MSLNTGTRIGPYLVESAIGAGGMGEVYRARDTKRNRDVAIKVLPEIFALDANRMARFTREAQTLAALNHPNIAHVHGLEQLPNHASALVMELVEGEDLSEIIARGPMPLTEALPIAKQIADALEAAHELGIVHRDLKPANIKVRADGTVKVLDFGLAKAMDQTVGSSTNVANSPTLTAHATAMDIIIGTAAYMAPRISTAGHSVNHRRGFVGRLDDRRPPALGWSAETRGQGRGPIMKSTPLPFGRTSGNRSDVAMTGTMGVAEAAFSSAGLVYLSGHNSAPTFSLIESDRAGVTRPVSRISRIIDEARWLPDHQRILLSIDAGNGFLWMLDVRRGSLSRLTFHNDAGGFAWNQPTGRVLYLGVGEIIAVSPDGGGREDVVYRPERLLGDLDVSSDGQFIIFSVAEATTSQLWLLRAATGKGEPWLANRFTQQEPRFSPDGRWVAYTSNETGQREVYVRATSGGGTKVQASTSGGWHPVWAPDQRELLYVDGTNVWAAGVTSGNQIDIGTPRKLLRLPQGALFQDVTPDGQRLLMLQRGPAPMPPAITFISGWLETIKTRAAR